MTVQHRGEGQAALANRVYRMYPGFQEAAILLLQGEDDEIQEAFETVYDLHEAPLVNLEEGVPASLESVGDCRLEPTTAHITVKGTGAGFMGMSFRPVWDSVSPSWRTTAVAEGSVWMALISASLYEETFLRQEFDVADTRALAPALPPLRVLRLEVLT